MTLEAGWFGKIPSLGDFASRRLPPEFIAVWDAWLQQSMSASRVLLGDQWLDYYLTSPIWRFVLMPGVFGPSAWTGLLMASVDKVGRHFPLTLALELDPLQFPDPMATTLEAHAWHLDLERVALSALDINRTPEDLEQDLAGIPFPLPGVTADTRAEVIQSLASWWRDSTAAPLCLDAPSVASMRNTVTATASRIFAGLAGGKTFWWTEARDSGTTQLHCVAGLPPDDYYAILIQGSDPLP